MLNKELLMIPPEDVGLVSVYTDILEGFYEKDHFYLYKFTGDNWSVGPQDTIYAEFTIDDATTTKVVPIPIGTTVYVDATYAVTSFDNYEGFERVATPYSPALKLTSKVASVALCGYYP